MIIHPASRLLSPPSSCRFLGNRLSPLWVKGTGTGAPPLDSAFPSNFSQVSRDGFGGLHGLTFFFSGQAHDLIGKLIRVFWQGLA